MNNSNGVHNESLKKKIPKKKKFGQISIVLNTNKEVKACEKDVEQNIYDFSETMKTKKKSINASENILLKNNEFDAIKKSRKKSKYIKSLNLIECCTNNYTRTKMFEKSDEEVGEQNIIDFYTKNNINPKIKSTVNALAHYKTSEEVSEQNINDSGFWKNLNQTLKSELNTLSDNSLENNSSKNNDSVVTKKLKKKKKHNKSLNSIELNTNNDIEINLFEKNYKEDEEPNIINSWNNISQKQKYKTHALADIDNVPTKKRKQKKNLDNSLNTNHDTEDITFEEVGKQNINDSETINCNIDDENVLDIEFPLKVLGHKNYFRKENEDDISSSDDEMYSTLTHKISKRRNTNHLNMHITDDDLSDISLENNSAINNKSVVTKKIKKIEKHNKSLNSIQLNTNNDIEIKLVKKTYEEDEPNINDSNFRENINLSSDTSSENNSSIDNDNIVTKKLKKKKNHNTNLNSIQLNTKNNLEIESFEKTYKEDEEPNIIDSWNNISQKRKYKINTLEDIDNVPTKKLKKKKNNDNSLNSFEFNTINDSEISQNHFKLKTLLNSMESNDFEGTTTEIETKFNLIKYLKNKEASLQNHPKFKQIKEMLSKKIMGIVNKNCQITNSDIVLLKTIGNIILEKIVEKVNAAQDINGIKITLPAECEENKIHFIETNLGRPPSKEKMNIIKKLNPQVKLRVFNIEEDNLIREYWSKFQKEYKVSNILPFLSNGLEMALDNTQRLQFVRYISAGLPNRLLSSVFIRFNVLFSGHQDKTRFSEEEDQLIMKVEKCDVIKTKLSVLSLILNRSRMQLYRRNGVLKNQFEKCKKVCWDDQKRQELFTNILLETNTDNWKDLKNLTLNKNTLIKVAENLGEDVTFEKVRKQWNYLYTMLFCEKPIKMLSLRLKILELLEQQNFKHFSDVDWIEITNQLYPGANSKLICDIFHCWIDKNVPSNLKKNIKDTLNYLREHIVDKIRKKIHKHGEREFPRLTVQDYDLA